MAEQENAPKTRGCVSAYLGLALFILAVLGFIGLLGRREGYPHFEGTLAYIVGRWLGLNSLTLCTFLLTLYSGLARKNRLGRSLLVSSGILLVTSTLLSLRHPQTRPLLESIQTVTSQGNEYEVIFPHPYVERTAYVQDLEVVVYETRSETPPYLRAEFTPLTEAAAQGLDIRTMLEDNARLAGLSKPEITVRQDALGRTGTYSGAKIAGGLELRVYGKVVVGARSMVSCLVVEPPARFPSVESAMLLGNIRRK